MATSVVNPAASEPQPAAAMEDQDFGSLDVADESGRRFGTGRLVLLLTALGAVLTLAVVIVGVRGIQLGGEQRGTREALQSFNQTFFSQLSGLRHRRNSTEQKLAALWKTLQGHGSKIEKDQKRLRVQLSNLQQDTKEVHCELVEMKSNGTKSGCCPKGWLAFKESCYWISSVTASWNNAQRDCERKQGHLVTINSPEEKVFVNQRKKPRHTWIGLTDVSGIWKWSDGTLYSFDRADWSQGQPDHWYGHGLGGGEDCVEMYPNGDWNDSHCSLLYYWICEMPLKS
ncbi:asialoglycoprotein receptor 1-like [Varanus komodoensis]|uniref:asialoglycoprotein receptor 1-like n=1 Tax=Varanus komodoensis TaxID=61221 RepID=UPI001CF77511|nr:asialoglycoprotein receptor 1-like [Varanus komodoensis]